MAKLVANNHDFLSIKLFLLFASRGLYLCISFDIINFLDIIICERINKKKTIDIFETM